MLNIVNKGMLTTIQDRGRRGYQRRGVSVSGAMDWYASSLANIIVGNSIDSPVLEATIIGPVIDIQQSCCFAITGAAFAPKLNRAPVPMNSPILAAAGSRLELGVAQLGARGYIAFSGGMDVELDLGSASTYMRAGLGGIDRSGRPLLNGDTIALLHDLASPEEPGTQPLLHPELFPVCSDYLPPYSASPLVRVVTEARSEYFAANAVEVLVSGSYKVQPNSDRMGYRLDRLEGPAIPYAPGCDGNIISEGIALGSIQVVGGKPFILMADRQTIGGYAKIGAVIRADLPLVAQLRPGDQLSFIEVSVVEAQEAYRVMCSQLSTLKECFSHYNHQGQTGARSVDE